MTTSKLRKKLISVSILRDSVRNGAGGVPATKLGGKSGKLVRSLHPSSPRKQGKRRKWGEAAAPQSPPPR